MYHVQPSAPGGLESSPEAAHAAAAGAGDGRDPGSGGGGPSSEHAAGAMERAAAGRGGTSTNSVPVHRRPSSGVIDMSRQMAKRTEAFEQLSALLQ